MNTQISIPVTTSTFLMLVDFLREQGSNKDPVVAVEDAIHYWMDNASWKQEDLMPELFTTGSRGYTWKYKKTSIFLPHDAEIRMRYKRQYHYAKVEGDEIKFQGVSVSPSTLVKTITGNCRNAWRDLWIKYPNSGEWKLADESRRRAEKVAQELDSLLSDD